MFRKRREEEDGSRVSLFFATDLHGSEVCYRKLLSAARAYGASILIMGGDCTGKTLVPIVQRGDSWTCRWSGEEKTYVDSRAVEELEKEVKNSGSYPVLVGEDEVERWEREPERIAERFSQTMADTVGDWMRLGAERLESTGVRLIVTPGNDDEFVVDEVLAEAPYIEADEGKVTALSERHQMLSVGWSNPTPWDTPRECSEEELAEKIQRLAGEIDDMSNAVFNIHVPPYDSGLDSAPELTDDFSVRNAGVTSVPVGSTAVREAIEEYQPLLSLHGHIHESRGAVSIGRTLAINPGSIYAEATLQGAICELGAGEVRKYQLTAG
ncbi:MAG: metallophosphoesterase [Actinobacteria bacterium]|nr:metallophosphoesterase [Actinomycetota bacterium]